MTAAENFIKVWNDSSSIDEVCTKLNMEYGSVRTTAWRYRKAGLNVPKKKTGRKNVAK